MLFRPSPALLAGLFLVAACRGDGGDVFVPDSPLAADPRCFGIAATPAWKIDFTITVNDTGTAADSFRVALHHQFVGTGTTSALLDFAPDLVDDLQWTARGATGTFQVHDTVTDLFTGELRTLTGQGYADEAPVEWARVGGYVIVDLDACLVSFEARPYGRVAHQVDGTADGVDTTLVGEFGIIQLPIDSAHVASGWTIPTGKFSTLAGYNWLPGGGQYLAYGYADRYTGGATLDSATVSLKVTPVDHP